MRSEEDRRIESLDRAFLFLIGLSGFVFSVLQAFIEGWEALLLFTPFLFSGLIYPFYIGCLRGAVERVSWKESMLQRARGWVYLGISSTAYAAMVLVAIFRDFVPEQAGLVIFPYLAIVLLGFPFSFRLIGWVRKMTNTSCESDSVVIRTTVAAAFLLVLSTFWMEEVVRGSSQRAQPVLLQNISVLLWLILISFLLFVLLEKVAIAQCPPEARLTWRTGRLQPTDLGQIWTSDLTTCLCVGIVSDDTAACLSGLSIIVWAVTQFLWQIIPVWVAWLVWFLAILLAGVALVIYLRVPTERVREISTSRSEFESRRRAILDC